MPTDVTDLLSEAEFWSMIDDARKRVRDDEHLADELITVLSSQPTEKAFAFQHQFEALSRLSYRSELWCAAYVACGGCSDDAFDYFRAWLIGRGKEAFYHALEDPDSLVKQFDLIRKSGAIPENEILLSVAAKAYQKKTGNDDFYKALKSTESEEEPPCLPNLEFNWAEDDEDSMRKICPKIFDKYWNDPF